MTGNGSGRFCPRMAERGNGGVAHGTHGIHGNGDERREPRKRKGAEFFITKDATGVGRGPEKLPANCAKGREWRSGESEEGPRNTRMTRKGDERWKTAEMKTETEFFYHERRETHERQRAGAGKLPANCAKGRDWKKVDSEEWPTEHTEDTEWGTFFYHETHETHERRRAGARDLRSGGYETGIFARGASSRSEGFVQAYRRA